MKIDLTKHLLREPKKRQLNRFSISELYYLLAGWTKLEDYVNGKQFTPQEAWVMQLGSLKHAWTQEHLKTIGYDVEIKKELKIGDIELVGVADALTKDHGLEIKTSDKLKVQASRAHEYQARMYASLFNVPLFYVMQPVMNSEKAYLKTIGEVKQNKKWFEKEVVRIQEFYKNKLLNYEPKKIL